jgi:DNA polymerase-3 subunit gamma/tau
MSYVVLARRYRPQRFADLVGQEHVAQTLKNAVLQKRIAHAYLFTGPRGVGKTSAARILAKAIRCLDLTSDGEPCDKCAACHEVVEGTSLDVIEIDAASNTGVDNIRELRENVEYMASVGKYRVYIIDEVHMLSTAAFNALLKTLEEPPPHVIFIFATTEVHKVLPTILSRCQRFDFKRVALDAMSRSLRAITEKEGVKIDEPSLLSIAQESDGCLRDAQSLLDQAIAFCGTDIRIATLEQALGLLDRGALLKLMRAVLTHDTGAALTQAHALLTQGIDPKILLGRIVEFYRNFHFFAFTGSALMPDPDFDPLYAEMKSKSSDDEIVRGLDLCLRQQTQLFSASNTAVSLESLIVRLSLQRPVFGGGATVAAPHPGTGLRSEPARSAPAPAAPAPTRTSASARAPSELEPPPMDEPPPYMADESGFPQDASPAEQAAAVGPGPTELKGQLETFLRMNKPAWMPVLASIEHLSLVDGTLRARARADFAGKRLASEDGLEVLRQVFKTRQASVQLSTLAETPRVNPAERAREVQQMAREHEGVKAALKVFDAQITETKVLDEGPRKRN